MGLLPGLLGASATILFYLSRGINSVLMKDAFNARIPSSFRNTANSLKSFAFRMSFFVVGPLIGFSIDQYGTRFTLISMGVFYFLIFLTLTLGFLRQLKLEISQ